MNRQKYNLVSYYLQHTNVHWQTAIADSRFAPEVFFNSIYGRNIMEMKRLFFEHWDNEMHPEVLEYWKNLGVKKELFDPMPDDYDGPLTLSKQWAVYTPIEMDLTKKYPVIYLSHGGGETAFSAETYGFVHLVVPEQLIVVIPNYLNGADEFLRVMKEVKMLYPVDESRVYAVGFSGGQTNSAKIGWELTDMLAGVGCMSGPNNFNQVTDPDALKEFCSKKHSQLPLICCGGDNDGGDHYPPINEHTINVVNTWMRDLCKVADYELLTKEESNRLVTESESTVKRAFGLNVQKDYITFSEGTFWYVGDYFDKYGSVVARIITGCGVPHLQPASHSCFIWSFLKHFSRNTETGELIYERPKTDLRQRWNKITYTDDKVTEKVKEKDANSKK